MGWGGGVLVLYDGGSAEEVRRRCGGGAHQCTFVGAIRTQKLELTQELAREFGARDADAPRGCKYFTMQMTSEPTARTRGSLAPISLSSSYYWLRHTLPPSSSRGYCPSEPWETSRRQRVIRSLIVTLRWRLVPGVARGGRGRY
jgi:hypothetical protein